MTLISSDGESFKVSRAVADESDTVKNTLCGAPSCSAVWRPGCSSRLLQPGSEATVRCRARRCLAVCASCAPNVALHVLPKLACCAVYSAHRTVLLLAGVHPVCVGACVSKWKAYRACLCAETGDDELVPLPNVKSRTLGKVIEYCKFHVEAREKNDAGKTAKTEDEVAAWDKDFVNVEQSQLFEIILVRPPVSSLRNLAAQAFACLSNHLC